MLVLARDEGQAVVIGDNVLIKLVRTRGGWGFAIDAPREIPVHRQEVVSKILASGRTLPSVTVEKREGSE